MGNRAVITTAPYSEDKLGIYVHWNGGQESIEGFLEAAKQLGYRTPGNDDSYAMARLAGAIALYFGGETSIGIGINRDLDTDNGDNGVWLLGDGWEIAGHTNGEGKLFPVGKLSAEHRRKANAIAKAIVAKTKAAEAVEV